MEKNTFAKQIVFILVVHLQKNYRTKFLCLNTNSSKNCCFYIISEGN